MLLKDKHSPKTLKEFIINKSKAERLFKYSKCNANMNFIFSGISGSGKFTLAKSYLAEMFGLDIYKTKKISERRNEQRSLINKDIEIRVINDKQQVTAHCCNMRKSDVRFIKTILL